MQLYEIRTGGVAFKIGTLNEVSELLNIEPFALDRALKVRPVYHCQRNAITYTIEAVR